MAGTFGSQVRDPKHGIRHKLVCRMSNHVSADLVNATDHILVERSVDGDSDAFAELIRRHSPIARAYAHRILGNWSEADDVVQDAFVRAWQQLHDLRNPAAVKAWLMRIVSRQAYAQIESRVTTGALDGYDPPVRADSQPEEIVERNAQLAALSMALNRLPRDQRRAWLLREIENSSYAEIAQEMQIPSSTVRGILARARTSIAAQMEGWR